MKKAMKIWFSEKFAKMGDSFRKIPEIKPTPELITALELARQEKISDEELKCLME